MGKGEAKEEEEEKTRETLKKVKKSPTR
jgi:hypothetical protein